MSTRPTIAPKSIYPLTIGKMVNFVGNTPKWQAQEEGKIIDIGVYPNTWLRVQKTNGVEVACHSNDLYPFYTKAQPTPSTIPANTNVIITTRNHKGLTGQIIKQHQGYYYIRSRSSIVMVNVEDFMVVKLSDEEAIKTLVELKNNLNPRTF